MGSRGRRAAGEDGEEEQAEHSAPQTGGRAERRRTARRAKRRRRLSAAKEIPILIGTAVVIALVLKTFLVQAFVIPSGSMEETIRIGDRVLVDKLTPWFGAEPQRGDVVVFHDPGGWLEGEQLPQSSAGAKQVKKALSFIGLLPSADEQDLIKRVVAVGGDTVACCDKKGRVTVNGTPLDEPYLHPGNVPSTIRFKVTVPVGRIFVMGDHRGNSADSRYHMDGPHHGTISTDQVVGRAVVIAWPVGHWRRLQEPPTFASVPDAPGAPSASGPGMGNPVRRLPMPAELPLVMGVVGLSRMRDRRQRNVRSGCGRRGRRHRIRLGRPRGRDDRRPEGRERGAPGGGERG
jgi:signal peptidase I